MSFLLSRNELQSLGNQLFLYAFDRSPEYTVLLIFRLEKQEMKKYSSEESMSFQLIPLLLNNQSEPITFKNVITDITSKKLSDIYSICFLGRKSSSIGNNGCLFNHLSWRNEAKNVKFIRKRSVNGCSSESPFLETVFGVVVGDAERKMQLLTPMFSRLNLRAFDDMPWGVEGLPPGLLLAVLGWSGRSSTPTIEAFDPAGNTWRYMAQEDFVYRAYHGVVLCGSELFVVGGFDGRRCRRSALCFDASRHRWSRRAAMRVARCYVSVVALGGRVCALGGCDGRHRFRSCERMVDGRWEFFADMRRVRSDASATVHQGQIFVSGGFDGEEVLSCAEIYDPRSDQWTLVEHPMGGPRSGHALLSFQGALWVIGGFDGEKRLNTVEVLEESGWVPGPSLLNPRSNFGTAVLHDQLYVIGGYNGARTFAEVERLDSGRCWRRARPLNKHRSAFGACVLVRAQNNCRATEPLVAQAVHVASP